MIRQRTPSRARSWLKLAAAGTSLFVITACTPLEDAVDNPPESEYTQAEAYAPMEALVADLVEALPDFPGFEQRSWAELPCTHNGVEDPDFTKIEVRYRFSLEDSETELVREQFLDTLRDHWTSLGYEITVDEATETGDRVDRDLVAARDDGLSVWYAVGGFAGVMVQSGCLPVSDEGDIEYVPPAGGIEPGGDGDKVTDYFPDGVPTDQAGAIDPFAGDQALPAPFDSPGTYQDLL